MKLTKWIGTFNIRSRAAEVGLTRKQRSPKGKGLESKRYFSVDCFPYGCYVVMIYH